MDRLTVLKTDNLIITIFKLIESILCNMTTTFAFKGGVNFLPVLIYIMFRVKV